MKQAVQHGQPFYYDGNIWIYDNPPPKIVFNPGNVSDAKVRDGRQPTLTRKNARGGQDTIQFEMVKDIAFPVGGAFPMPHKCPNCREFSAADLDNARKEYFDRCHKGAKVTHKILTPSAFPIAVVEYVGSDGLVRISYPLYSHDKRQWIQETISAKKEDLEYVD